MKEEGKEGRTEDGKGNWKGGREGVDGGEGGKGRIRKGKRKGFLTPSPSPLVSARGRKGEDAQGRKQKEAESITGVKGK